MKNQVLRNIISDTSYLLGHFFYWLLFLADMAMVVMISPWGSGMDVFTGYGTDPFGAYPEYATKEAYYFYCFKKMSFFIIALIIANILFRKKHKVWAFVVLLIPFIIRNYSFVMSFF